MAVCRLGPNSDVYVVYKADGGIECHGCALFKDRGFNAPDEAAMISHLKDHAAAGHKVPSEAFERLENWAGL
jgi:hypothetical protein